MTGAGAEPSIYDTLLKGHTGPIAPLWVFGAAAGLILALIGHPVAAAIMTIGGGALDYALVRWMRTWPSGAAQPDHELGLKRLSSVVMVRNTAILAVPAATALTSHAPIDALFVTVMAFGTLLVVTMQSLYSVELFREAAVAPVLAIVCGIAAQQTKFSDAALFGALVWLGAILAMIGFGAVRAKAEWLRQQAVKNGLIAELTAARDEAHRANQARSAFLATMSHEIRTPMNGVLGMAELLRRSRLSTAQRGQVETVIRSGELLMTILNDILDISTLDAGKMEIIAAPGDPRALLRDTVEAWTPVAAEKGLSLDLAIDPDLPDYLMIDQVRLRQILFNLIGNAIKFTDRGGVGVSISGVEIDGRPRLCLEVADTGVGIAPSAMPKLFEPFSQADNSDVRRFGGTGLGLAICHKLCGLMGGEISVHSTAGQGATLRVALPLEATDQVPAAPPAIAPAVEEPEGDGLSILIADDNPTNLLVLEHLLGTLGYHIYKAAGGPEALQALSSQAFDLVLMDIQMPEMTGIDVLQAVRGRPGPNRDTPLIAVTADAMSNGRDRYLDLGFADYVTKPVQAGNLITAMMAAVANAGTVERPARAAS